MSSPITRSPSPEHKRRASPEIPVRNMRSRVDDAAQIALSYSTSNLDKVINNPPCTIQALPLELIEKITRYLSQEDLIEFGKTCQRSEIAVDAFLRDASAHNHLRSIYNINLEDLNAFQPNATLKDYLKAMCFVKASTGVDQEHNRPLLCLRHIKTLNLSQIPITQEDLESIKKTFPNLSYIKFKNITTPTEINVDFFKILTALEVEHVDDSYLSNLKVLKINTLEIKNSNITNAGLVYLHKNYRGLKTLYIHDDMTITDAGAINISYVKTLSSLTIESCDITDEGMNHFTYLQNLTYLSLENDDPNLTSRNFREIHALNLSHLQKLDYLTLDSMTHLKPDSLTKAIIALPNLKFLDLINIRLDAQFFPVIASQEAIANLKRLKLDSTFISNNALDFIYHYFVNLEEFTITDCKNPELTESGLTNLASNLPKLKTLEISSVIDNLTDEVFEQIFRGNRERLVELYFHNNPLITDRSIKLIPSRLPNLKLLNIGRCPNISEEAFNWLSQLMPDLTIETGSIY